MGRNPATQKDAFDAVYDIAIAVVKIETLPRPSKDHKQKKKQVEREK